jgi:hypothetical protein
MAVSDRAGFGSRKIQALKWLLLGLILVACALFRVYLFYRGNFWFDSDQAVAGIGALRLLNGGPHYVLTPGQSHGGEFYSYYYVPFHLFAQPSVALLRLGMIPLALLLALTTYLAARAMFGSEIWAFTALLLIAFPAALTTDWYTRPHSLYVIVQTGFNLSIVCLFRLLATFETEGWSARNVLLGTAIGFLCGFCFWSHFSMILVVVAFGILVLSMPRILLNLAGFIDAPDTKRPGLRGRLLSALLQGALLTALVVLSGLLILGGRDFELAGIEIGMEHLRNPLAVVSTLLVLRIVLGLFLPGRPIRQHLGMVPAFVGLWAGAAPLIIYVWVQGESVLDLGSRVRDSSTFWNQTLSVFQTGIPMLVGPRHWNATEVAGIPAWVKVTALGIHYVSFLCVLLCAMVGKLRRWPATNGCLLVVAVFVLQVLTFGCSAYGWYITDPRYILLLHWALSMAVGGVAYLISRLPRRLGWFALVPIGFLCFFNIWTNLVAPAHEVVKPTGEAVADRTLLEFLQERNLNRVSCRFALPHYWIAYKMTYISGEKVILAPAPHPQGLYIRSEKYQRMVDESETRAYLLTTNRSDVLRSYLETAGCEFKMEQSPPYFIFYDLSPDVLNGLDYSTVEATVKARTDAPPKP